MLALSLSAIALGCVNNSSPPPTGGGGDGGAPGDVVVPEVSMPDVTTPNDSGAPPPDGGTLPDAGQDAASPPACTVIGSGYHFAQPAPGFAAQRVFTTPNGRVYWLDYAGPGAGTIYMNAGGAAATTTALITGLGDINGLAVDDSYVYWSESGSTEQYYIIKRMGAAGGPAVVLDTDILDGGGNLGGGSRGVAVHGNPYWSDGAGDNSRTCGANTCITAGIRTLGPNNMPIAFGRGPLNCNPDAGPPACGPGFSPRGILLADQNAVYGMDIDQGLVGSVALGSDIIQTVFAGLSNPSPYGLAEDDALAAGANPSIYWADRSGGGGGTIYWMHKSGGSVQSVQAGLQTGDIAVDETGDVYYVGVEMQGGNNPLGIWKRSTTAGGQPVLVIDDTCAPPPLNLASVAVDLSYVYATDSMGGRVLKVHR